MSLQNILTKQKIQECAEQIVSAFSSKATPDNLEMDFHIAEGKMKGGLGSPNTTFKFDIEDDSPLGEIKAVISETFESDDATEADAALVEQFQKDLCAELAQDKYRQDIGDALRGDAGLNVPGWLVPIENMVFHNCEITTDAEGGQLLRVHKEQDTGTEGVAPDLLKTHQETGKDFETIIAEKKASGDSRYEFVTGAEFVRYIFDVHVEFAADYSFCEYTGDVEDKIKEIIASQNS